MNLLTIMRPAIPSTAAAAYFFHGDRTAIGTIEIGADVTGDVSGAATGVAIQASGFSVAVDAPSPATSRAVT